MDTCDALGPVPYPGADFLICCAEVDHAGDHTTVGPDGATYTWPDSTAKAVAAYLNH